MIFKINNTEISNDVEIMYNNLSVEIIKYNGEELWEKHSINPMLNSFVTLTNNQYLSLSPKNPNDMYIIK